MHAGGLRQMLESIHDITQEGCSKEPERCGGATIRLNASLIHGIGKNSQSSSEVSENA
jgi:hypothetical protein